MHFNSAVVSLVLLASFVPAFTARTVAQDDKGKPKKVAAEAEAPKKNAVLEALRAAPKDQREKPLMAYIKDQIASSAFYTGQYDELKNLAGTSSHVQAWIAKPPDGETGAAQFRIACIRAVRDIHGEKAPAELMKALEKVVTDQALERQVREAAVFALAQFGNRTFVSNMIKQFTKMIEDENAVQKANGYMGLANLQYQIRDYKAAVAAWRGVLGLVEAGTIRFNQGPQIHYYNAACSAALGGMTDQAFAYLTKSLQMGDGLNRRLLEEDRDIVSLRGDERFSKLMAEYFGKKKADAKTGDKAGDTTGDKTGGKTGGKTGDQAGGKTGKQAKTGTGK